LISWKYSFEKISKDLELAKKKKEALDNLFNSGRISASTHGSLDSELGAMIADIELRQKILAKNLTTKVDDLVKQISTLELFLANSEIQYAAGEIDDEIHANESNAFSNGLRSLKTQLSYLIDAVATIESEVAEPTTITTPTENGSIETETETEETTELVSEAPPQSSIEEPAEIPTETPVEVPESQIQETITPAVTAPVVKQTLEPADETPLYKGFEIPEIEIEEPVETTSTPYEAPIEEHNFSSAIDFPTQIPIEAPVEAPEVVVEETIEEQVTIEETPIETTSEAPVDETVVAPVEPVFDELAINTEDPAVESTTKEAEITIKPVFKMPSTEEVTEEIISKAQVEEISIEEETFTDDTFDETDITEDADETLVEEEVVEEVADDEELTIEDDSDDSYTSDDY
jgi:hypothetical protein